MTKFQRLLVAVAFLAGNGCWAHEGEHHEQGHSQQEHQDQDHHGQEHSQQGDQHAYGSQGPNHN